MRIKTDYMGNAQLLPAYNVQIGVADEYIAVVEVNQYRSDMDCFVSLMEKFKDIYGFYEISSYRFRLWLLQQLHFSEQNGKVYEVPNVQEGNNG